MTKDIASTPTLTGKDAKKFLERENKERKTYQSTNRQPFIRQFYIKRSGEYLTKNMTWTKVRPFASTFTDTEYDSIKHQLPNNHTLELVINPNI